jgi:hypothetical protein
MRTLDNPQTDLPRIAKDRELTGQIEAALREVKTVHDLRLGDARSMDVDAGNVHLVLTSPPYWTLKEYRNSTGQLGHVADYDEFLSALV